MLIKWKVCCYQSLKESHTLPECLENIIFLNSEANASEFEKNIFELVFSGCACFHANIMLLQRSVDATCYLSCS